MDVKKSLRHAFISNIFEWYDFTIILQFSNQISEIFFPQESRLAWTTLLLISGHIARFCGSFILGHIGDVLGRKPALFITVSLMGLSCFAISILPTYNEIGLFASILLILLRIIQGILLGGGYASVLVYAIEHTKSLGIFVSGIVTGSSAIGVILATVVCITLHAYLNEEQMIIYGWRLAIILGTILPAYIFIKRQEITETPKFGLSKKDSLKKKFSYSEIFLPNIQRFTRSIGVGMSVGAMYTIFYSVILAYGQNLLDKNSDFEILELAVTFVFSAFLSCIIFSFVAQKFILPIKLSKICLILTLISIFPASKMLFGERRVLQFFAQTIFGILLGMNKSVMGYLLASNFPSEIRIFGVSMSNNISSLLSYCIPMVLFSTLSSFAPELSISFIYPIISICSLITFISIKATIKLDLKI